LKASAFRDYRELRDDSNSHAWLGLTTLAGPLDESPNVEATPDYRSKIEEFVADIRQWWKSGSRVVVCMAGHGSTERLVATLMELGIPARQSEELTVDLKDEVIEVTVGHQSSGLNVKSAGLVLVTEVDLFGSRDASKETR
jgi:transcription-repair coupling factor (superfamily II helicase)